MRKMSVKPGLTCLWQVHGRHTITDFADWARLDLKYIDTWSLLNDLAILFRTPIAVIKGTGH
jgi:lipopolysaccharide/colanic/teichoic acid biosynthesis glycosyltransferase